MITASSVYSQDASQKLDARLVFEPPIPAKNMISVEKYDKKSGVYFIRINKEPGVGPNRAMPGDLADAISTLERKKLESEPENIVGNEYLLNKDLRLLTDAGVAMRADILKKKKLKSR